MSRYHLSTALCGKCGKPLVREWLVYFWPVIRHADCDQAARRIAAEPEEFAPPPTEIQT